MSDSTLQPVQPPKIYHLKQPDDARLWRDKAQAWFTDHPEPQPETPAKERLTWQEKIDFQHLLKEANALIGEGE